MSKADGETLEDFCTLFSFCKESEEQNHKETFENIKKRFEGMEICILFICFFFFLHNVEKQVTC